MRISDWSSDVLFRSDGAPPFGPHGGDLQASVGGGGPGLPRQRGVARQGGRLCDPGAGGSVGPQHQRLLLPRRRPDAVRGGATTCRYRLPVNRQSPDLLMAVLHDETLAAVLVTERPLTNHTTQRVGQGGP